MDSERRAFIVAQNGSRIFGGGEHYVVGLLARLQARGHRVLFLCRDEYVRSEAERRGVEARVFHVGGHLALHDGVRLARFLEREAPDALFLTSFNKTFVAALAGRMAGMPRIIARFGLSSDIPSRRFVYPIALRRWVHRVVVNSTPFRDAVRESLPRVAPERIITIYNGVDIPERRNEPGAVRRELGISPVAPVIGALARLSGQKRLDRLIRITAALPPEVVCLIAGHGPGEADLRALAGEIGVADRVRFLGYREDVADVLDALDVYVVTSATEGLSNSMLEALACGVPVISTPVSGASVALEPLADGRVPGRIVEADLEALTAAVGELLRDPDLRGGMSEAARDRILERFNWDDKLDRWERLFTGDPMAPVGEGEST
ncbi:MAG: glycosyltransferase family 4 protein [Gemmatimonadales bacterium]